jgi:hypothetical protein
VELKALGHKKSIEVRNFDKIWPKRGLNSNPMNFATKTILHYPLGSYIAYEVLD